MNEDAFFIRPPYIYLFFNKKKQIQLKSTKRSCLELKIFNNMFFRSKYDTLKKGIALTPFLKKQKKDKRSIAPTPFIRKKHANTK